MKGNRKVFLSNQRIGTEYILKIKENATNWRSWFVYDERTKSIRLNRNRNFAISNQRFIGLRDGGYAVVRKFVHGADQQITFKGTNILNKRGSCLTTRSFLNQDEQALTWFECRGQEAQNWVRSYEIPKLTAENEKARLRNIEQAIFRKLSKVRGFLRPAASTNDAEIHGAKFARRDALRARKTHFRRMVFIRAFQLRLRVKGGRTVYVTRERSGPDHLLKIGKNPSKERSLFIHDRRTNSIRLAASPSLAISNQYGRGVKLGGNVVLRKWRKSKTQFAVLGKNHQVLNKNGDCLTPHFYNNKEGNNLTWWNCNDSRA